MTAAIPTKKAKINRLLLRISDVRFELDDADLFEPIPTSFSSRVIKLLLN